MARDWYILYDTTSGEIRMVTSGVASQIEGMIIPSHKAFFANVDDAKVSTMIGALDPNYLDLDDANLPNLEQVAKLSKYARYDISGETMVWCTSRIQLTIDGVEKSVEKPQTDLSATVTVKKMDYDDVVDTSATDTITLSSDLGTLSDNSIDLVNGEGSFTITFPTDQTSRYVIALKAYNASDVNVGVGVFGIAVTV